MTIAQPLGIAGLGLIGGSIALRARRLGIRTMGWDTDASALRLVDVPASSLAALGGAAATLVLALPLEATLAAIDDLAKIRGPRLVIDVASVKVPVARRAAGWDRFVGTHPLAGSERSGAAAADPELFEGRAWAYVPAEPERDAATRAFIVAMGGVPVAVEAESHDRAVALTSHLPQVAVSALAAYLAEEVSAGELAGPGLASTLRLAGSPWTLWEPIVRANAPALARALRAYGSRLQALAGDLEAGDVGRLASYFEDARDSYERFVRPPRE